jgi:hypothetical protein
MAQPSSQRRFDHDLLRVGAIACSVSVFSLLYYSQRGQILLYGDAVAHINIARRVFDSQTPGLLQLGTVWLPLPHLLMIPFLLSDDLWRSGLGGSIPSMIAYALCVVGIFRLVREMLGEDGRTSLGARIAPWVAALVIGANPNLIYLQATAMTESLYLALFVWTVVYAFEFIRACENPEKLVTTKGTLRIRSGQAKVHEGKNRVLWECLASVAGAELTRYDGWFLAAATGATLVALLLKRRGDATLRRRGVKFLLGTAVVPALWLAYNAAVYRNPLEFANGPYSAKAIAERSGALNPAEGHVFVAASYFLKSAELNVASGNWGRLLLAVAVAAMGYSIAKRAFVAPLVLLWMPLLFYTWSIAHGGVPLYVPSWWPFTWYNIRYGVQLLPLFAVSTGVLVAAAVKVTKRYGATAAAVVCALVIFSYTALWRTEPLCLTEAVVNARTRMALEAAVVKAISHTPPQARFLMYMGNHSGVFQQAGIPLRQVVNEGNHRPWKKPSDTDGLWERALADPPRYVDYVIGFEDDAVERDVRRKDLELLSEIHATGQASAQIYKCVANGEAHPSRY